MKLLESAMSHTPAPSAPRPPERRGRCLRGPGPRPDAASAGAQAGDHPLRPPCGAAAKPPAAAAAPTAVKDPVVAVVNGQQIRLSELEIAQQSLPQQYRSMPLQAVFPALLERIIDSKLVVQEGKKTKTNDDPAFKKRMAFVEGAGDAGFLDPA